MAGLFVTLTLKPMYYGWAIERQFDHFSNEIRYIMAGVNYEFVAELTLNGNVHFHGVVCSGARHLMPQLKKVFGHINVQRIKNYSKAIGYIYKDYAVTRKAGIKKPIIIPDKSMERAFKSIKKIIKEAREIPINHYREFTRKSQDNVVDI